MFGVVYVLVDRRGLRQLWFSSCAEQTYTANPNDQYPALHLTPPFAASTTTCPGLSMRARKLLPELRFLIGTMSPIAPAPSARASMDRRAAPLRTSTFTVSPLATS